jgi:hypothetical protein
MNRHEQIYMTAELNCVCDRIQAALDKRDAIDDVNTGLSEAFFIIGRMANSLAPKVWKEFGTDLKQTDSSES